MIREEAFRENGEGLGEARELSHQQVGLAPGEDIGKDEGSRGPQDLALNLFPAYFP